jgi:hypothetical protein
MLAWYASNLAARTVDGTVRNRIAFAMKAFLPPELLLSLRQWWTVRPTRYDADVTVSERWLFIGGGSILRPAI